MDSQINWLIQAIENGQNVNEIIKLIAKIGLDLVDKAELNAELAVSMSSAKNARHGLLYKEILALFSTQHPLDNCTEGFAFRIILPNGEVIEVASAESLYHTLKFNLKDRKALAQTPAQKAAQQGRSLKMADSVTPEIWDNLLRFVSMILALVLKMTAYPDVFANLEEIVQNGQFPCEVQGPNFKNVWTLTTGDNLLGACLVLTWFLLDKFRSEGIVDLQEQIKAIVNMFVDEEELKSHIMDNYYGEIVAVEACKVQKAQSNQPKKAVAQNNNQPKKVKEEISPEERERRKQEGLAKAAAAKAAKK